MDKKLDILSGIKIPNSVINKIKEDCKIRPHEEACGLIVINGNIDIISCENKSKFPKKSFYIDEKIVDNISKKHRIIGYYHSHIYDNCDKLSWVDKSLAEVTKKISILYALKCDKIEVYYPNGWVAPLIGRDYVTGLFDSFSLVKDFYKELNINNHFSYHRYTTPIHQFSVNNSDIFEKILKKYNFFILEEKKDNCLCMFLINDNIHDFGIYLGENLYLTHFYEEKSKIVHEEDIIKKYKINYYGWESGKN